VDRSVSERDLTAEDLYAIGIGEQETAHILLLLQQEALLNSYLRRGEKLGVRPITRASAEYPVALRRKLGLNSPGVLWARGDTALLKNQAVAVVGSRTLQPENRQFAREAGNQAARQGFVLVSGNARGADTAAQNGCLSAGGQVISVVADRLEDHEPTKNILWLSEDSYDLDFSPQRALSRNRVIHALPGLTLVAQCRLEKGGTWSGTWNNLRGNWSPVCCFRDGSEASVALEGMGANLIVMPELQDLTSLGWGEQLSMYK
jgi:predicted Rossmann fold nucleotide-binding protein DprA/Smf involved in DNA uptake